MAAAWRVLGIERTADRGAIRRAYADRLRAMDPDADPDAYQDLRDARDAALAWAKTAAENGSGVVDVPDTGEAIDVEPRPGLRDLPITAPMIDRDVAAPVTATPSPSPSPLRIAGGGHDSGAGDDIALPIGDSFATPLVPRDVERAPVTILTNDAIVGAYDIYRDILLPPGELSHFALTDEERMAAMRAIERFMLDPRLEQLEFRDHASTWIAAVAADAIPRSDPVLYRLAQLFDWRAQAGSLNEPPAIARVNERLDALDFVAAVSNPGHEWNGAWRELTTPATERSRRGFVRRSKVEALLGEVRQKHPEVEGWFDGYRVGLWENRIQGPGSSWWIILLVILAIRLLTLAGGNATTDLPTSDTNIVLTNAGDPALPPGPIVPKPPQPIAGLSEPLSDMDRNLTSSLLTLGDGFDIDRAKRENPGLYRELVALWRKTKAKDGRLTDLDEAVSSYIESRVDRAAQVAPVELATKLAQNSLDQALDIRRRLGDEACAAYFDASKSSSQSQDLARKRWRLLIGAVFAVPPKKLPAEPNYRYTIPGALVDEVRQRLDWSSERLTAAFDRNGPPADICRAEIGLREVVLDKPSAYLSVLRHL